MTDSDFDYYIVDDDKPRDMMSDGFDMSNPVDVALSDEEQALRAHLFSAAAEAYPDVIGSLKTSYTDTLTDYQAKLNALKKENNPDAANVLILDPEKILIGKKFGMRDHLIIAGQAKAQGLQVDDVIFWDSLIPPQDFGSHYAEKSFTTSDGKMNSHIVVAPAYECSTICNFTPVQREDNLRYHEGGHFLDDRFLPAQTKKHNPPYEPNPKDLLTDNKLVQNAILVQKAEGFADMNAAGEMIRQGDSVDIIDAIIDRVHENPDLGHQTGEILAQFKKHIEKMGVDHFRNLDEKTSLEMYAQIADEEAVTPEQLRMAARIHLNQKDDRDPLDGIEQSDDPKIQKDIERATYYSGHLDYDRPVKGFTEEPIKKEKIAEAKSRLMQHTVEQHGKITPLTEAQSFVSMQGELSREYNENRGDMRILAAAYMSKTMYFRENAAVGVNLIEAENLSPTSFSNHANLFNNKKK